MADMSCPECAQSFPLRLGTGVCQKCDKINREPVGTAGRTEAETFHQCYACGITRKRGMLPVSAGSNLLVCGSAQCSAHNVNPGDNNNDNGNVPLATASQAQEINYSQAIRTDNLRQRMKLQSAKNMPHFQVQIPAIPGKSSLQVVGAGSSAILNVPEPQCLIGYQVRVDGKLDTLLGAILKAYSMTRHLTDIKEEIVAQINAEWVRDGRECLLPREVGIRWSGNRSLEENTTTLTLRKFFEFYASRMNINTAIGIQNVPSIFKPTIKMHKTMPMAFFDMLIYHKEYKARINSAIYDDVSPSEFMKSALRSVAKRPRNTSSAALEGSKAGKHRNTGLASASQFKSMFRPSTRSERASVHSASSVTLSKVVAVSDSLTGAPSLLRTNSEVVGLLSDTSMAHGLMKLAFEASQTHLIIPGSEKRFVAKRFFRSEACEDEDDDNFSGIELMYVEPKTHSALIEDELLRLAEASWFLKEFYRFCQKEYPQVQVEKKIRVVEAYIGTETTRPPSVASGIPRNHDGDGMSWLVEEKRPSSVQKFSGTLQHGGSQKDPVSSTVYAFSHFVLWHSHGSRVLADVQGTLTNINGIDTTILFDIMSHTTDGESGAGDFGQEGIDSFVKTHCCSSMCKALDLDKLHPLIVQEDTEPEVETDK